MFQFGQDTTSAFSFTPEGSPRPAHSRQSTADIQDAPDGNRRPADSQAGVPVPVLQFSSQADGDVSESFSFRFLHNATPIPSRQGSPRASPEPQSAASPSPPSDPSPSRTRSGMVAMATTTDGRLPAPNFSLPRTVSSKKSTLASRMRSLSLQSRPPPAVATTSGGHLAPPIFKFSIPQAVSAESTTARMRSVSLEPTPIDLGSSSLGGHTASPHPTPSVSGTAIKNSSDDQRAPIEPKPIPYDVKDESAPPHRFFTSAFQRSLRNGLDIAKDAVVAINQMKAGAEIDDQNIKTLFREAKAMTSFHASDTRRIAILGDSGEGAAEQNP